MHLDLSVDDVLTTTRAVRRRLDTSRPVERAVIEECLDIAFQAPNGSNRNDWRWIVVDDRDLVRRLADEYKAAMGLLHDGTAPSPRFLKGDTPREDRLLQSAFALPEKLPDMPALLLPLMPGRVEGKSAVEQAAMWGSILPAAWSFMLAARERGLGTCWATVTTRREREIAEILGIPFEDYTHVGMFPIAYTIGTDFKRGYRKPVSEVTGWNGF
jgi:nitroreductase